MLPWALVRAFLACANTVNSWSDGNFVAFCGELESLLKLADGFKGAEPSRAISMTEPHNLELAEYTSADLRKRAAGLLIQPDVVGSEFYRHVTRGGGIANPHPRLAAILIPIIDRKPEATVLITLRSESLSVHAGQIAFPGGKLEHADMSPAETALREAEEEVGLARDFIDLIGFLDCYWTNKGFCIAPALGVVASGFDLKIDEREVAEAFEVPLRFLMTPKNHEWHQREINGEHRDYYAIPYQEHHIWGVTAGIIRRLYEKLYSSP